MEVDDPSVGVEIGNLALGKRRRVDSPPETSRVLRSGTAKDKATVQS